MKIYSKNLRCECEVYAIQLSIDQESAKKNVVFYVAEEGVAGLEVAGLSDSDILDPTIEEDFKFLYEEETSTTFIIWNYFKDSDDLGAIVNYDDDPDAIEEFEKARKIREESNNKTS